MADPALVIDYANRFEAIAADGFEGKPYDAAVLPRDVRQIVREYSPFGFIYQPGSGDPSVSTSIGSTSFIPPVNKKRSASSP